MTNWIWIGTGISTQTSCSSRCRRLVCTPESDHPSWKALNASVSGITLAPSTLSEFITFLTSSPHSHAISFEEFRDFLLLLPRKASPEEIFRYYEVRKFLGDDGRGAARVTMEGVFSVVDIQRILTAIAPRKVMLV